MVTGFDVEIGGARHVAQGESVIDSRAAVDPDAEIGFGCRVGPFAYIGSGVKLGPGCVIHPHAVVQGPADIGPENVVHPFASIGGPPQDVRYSGERTVVLIGRGNDFREHVTVNRGTMHGGGATVIGDGNLFMAYCHVAHDCVIGSRCIMANHATLAGHVVVEDFAVFGGMTAVGAFLRIGESAMLAAGSMIERDAPPFCTVAGDRARLRAVNRVGVARRGIDAEAKRQIKAIFRALRERGRPLAEIDERIFAGEPITPEAKRMLLFLQRSGRGVIR